MTISPPSQFISGQKRGENENRGTTAEKRPKSTYTIRTSHCTVSKILYIEIVRREKGTKSLSFRVECLNKGSAVPVRTIKKGKKVISSTFFER